MTDQSQQHSTVNLWKAAGIPLSAVAVLVVQSGLAFWWASDINARVKMLEVQSVNTHALSRELAEIRAKQNSMAEDVGAIKHWLLSRRSAGETYERSKSQRIPKPSL